MLPNLWTRIHDATQTRRAYRIIGLTWLAVGLFELFESSHRPSFENVIGILFTLGGLWFVFGKHPRTPASPVSLHLTDEE